MDLFYHHRPDLATPIEETMGALAHAVRSGKALYVGISNCGPIEAAQAIRILRELGTPCLLHQPCYNMLDRWVEPELLGVLEKEGVGCIPFSPLAKGLLANRYFAGIAADSRAGHDPRFLRPEHVTSAVLAKTRQLDGLASARDQTLAQMALAWVLRRPPATSALIGAHRHSSALRAHRRSMTASALPATLGLAPPSWQRSTGSWQSEEELARRARSPMPRPCHQ